MVQRDTFNALALLQAAADDVDNAWPTLRWNKLSGPGPDSLELDGRGVFAGLALVPGQPLTLRCRLNLPAELAGTLLAGDRLEATVFSIYPVTLSWDEDTVLAAGDAPVAPGPALVQVIPRLKAGDNGDLEFTIIVPDNQTVPWCSLRFSTPRLRERFELLDVAWAQLAMANALATSEAEQALVAHAARLVPQAPGSLDSPTLQAALNRMTTALAPFAARAMQLGVHLVGHSHIDMNWLWTWSDTSRVIARDIAGVLDLMAEYPELCFTHSQPATYEVIRQSRPDLFERIREYIGQGRWEAATAMWVEGDVNLAAGEALARQFLEGVAYSREMLGTAPTVCLAPDTFGHAGNLPQLAASAGVTCYYHHRCNPGGRDYWPAYWWYGQDGSRVLAMSTSTYNGEIRARDLVTSALAAHRHGQTTSLHFHGVGDHGGGPAKHNLDALRRFQQLPLMPAARCSTIGAYSAELLGSGVELPSWHGESSTIFEGCYTTHADTKRYNRAAENLLQTADTLSVLAGLPAEPELRAAWRSALFHQFHDILDGSAIREAYAEQAAAVASIEATATRVIDDALATLRSVLPAGLVAVTNPTGIRQQAWITAARPAGGSGFRVTGSDGQHITGQLADGGLGFVAQLEPFSTVSFSAEPDDAATADALVVEPSFAPNDRREPNVLSGVEQAAPFLRIETPHFEAFVRRDSGIIVSLVDKRVGRQLVGYGLRRATDYVDSARPDLALNVLQLLDEHPHSMSAWQLHEVYRETSLLRGAQTTVVERGPARVVLEVQHAVRSSRIRQRIVLYRDMAVIDFETTVDWNEVGDDTAGVPTLKVAFNCRLAACEAWFESPFAAVQRPCDGQEVPALRWADIGGREYGFAVLNDSKYGYDALGSRLRLTLLRGAYYPDTCSDSGVHTIRYRLVPHSGDWREAGIVQHAIAYNQMLLAHAMPAGTTEPATAHAHAWQPLLQGDRSIILGGLKLAHASDGTIVRLYESSGRRGRAILANLPPGAKLFESNVVEHRGSNVAVHDGQARLDFEPWQVRTLLLDINRA